jgi:hypothetical protein
MVLHVKANVIIPTQEKAFRLIQEIAKLDMELPTGFTVLGLNMKSINRRVSRTVARLSSAANAVTASLASMSPAASRA